VVSDVGHIIPCNIASIKRPGEVCACLGCYTVHVASCVLMFWDSILVPSARGQAGQEEFFLCQ